MPSLFADTFYFIALLDSSDPAHARAVAWSRQKGNSFGTHRICSDRTCRRLSRTPPQRANSSSFGGCPLQADPKFRVLQTCPGALRGRPRRSTPPVAADKHCTIDRLHQLRSHAAPRIRDALTGDHHFTPRLASTPCLRNRPNETCVSAQACPLQPLTTPHISLSTAAAMRRRTFIVSTMSWA